MNEAATTTTTDPEADLLAALASPEAAKIGCLMGAFDASTVARIARGDAPLLSFFEHEFRNLHVPELAAMTAAAVAKVETGDDDLEGALARHVLAFTLAEGEHYGDDCATRGIALERLARVRAELAPMVEAHLARLAELEGAGCGR